ncbi:MAG: permease [Dehalococcoidales bacterium]|nr:permease [Dehalococcoidales bacterium]
MLYILYSLTGLALVISFISSREKTLRALKITWRRFINILPAFLLMLVMVSIVLFLVPERYIIEYLGTGNSFVSVLTASLIGSIIAMPGFIVFPLCGILLEKGVLYMVLSAFTTTLMMVGVLSYPVEKAYLGTRVTILRNALSFGIALIIALVTGILFGEIFS